MHTTMVRHTINPKEERISRGTMDIYDDSIANIFIWIGWKDEPNERSAYGEASYDLPSESSDKHTKMQDLVAARLMSYLDLTDNWDGFGGIAPISCAVFDALEFLDQTSGITSPPQSMLSSDGEVDLLWKSGEVYLDIGFTGDKTFSYYAEGELGVSDQNESIQMKDRIHLPIKLEQVFSQLDL
jgi:hypothetical protein